MNPVEEDVPHSRESCRYEGCGIYVAKSVGQLRGRWEPYDHALGVVALSGKVIEEEDGYRGKFGTVLAMSAGAVRYWWTGDDPRHVRRLFLSPIGFLQNHGSVGSLWVDPVDYLERWRMQHSDADELSRRIDVARRLNPHSQLTASESIWDDSLPPKT